MVTPITDFGGGIAVIERILNAADGQRVGATRRRFKQGGFERQNAPTIGAGSFRKQDNQRARIERRLNFAVLLAHLSPPGAVHEHGAGQLREPANQGPEFDSRLATKTAGAREDRTRMSR